MGAEKAPKHHYQAEGELLCGCASFTAYSEARYGCLHCVRRLEGLLHAVRQIVRVRGICDYSVFDKRTRKAIELAFAMEPIEDVPADAAMETE